MNHQRHIIREAIVSLLASAGTSAGSRVYDTPYDPRTVFPALVVEADLEEQQADNFGNSQTSRFITRNMRLIVNAEIQATTNYARSRDQLLADVESTLAASSIAGVKSITPGGYSADLSMMGERPIAIGRQMFSVVYVTTQGNPASIN